MIASRLSRWLPFPDPGKRGYLSAPFGPGVYELRNRKTGESVLFGRSKNVARRMSSLLPKPLGTGTRNNEKKSEYVLNHLADIDYRTKSCTSDTHAVEEERALRQRSCYIFPT